MNKQLNLQDVFLNQARKEKISITIYLTNGFQFKGMVKGEVVRYELPEVCCLNYVMQAALGGGVTRSLSVDMHGKGFSSYLLDMEI